MSDLSPLRPVDPDEHLQRIRAEKVRALRYEFEEVVAPLRSQMVEIVAIFSAVPAVLHYPDATLGNFKLQKPPQIRFTDKVAEDVYYKLQDAAKKLAEFYEKKIEEAMRYPMP